MSDAMWAADRASQGLGMTLDSVAPGRATLSMRVTEAMVNGLGLCHGGFIFTLADSAMAFAANGPGSRAVAQHAAITFLRPGKLDELLTATAEARATAGRTGLYDVRVTGEAGAVIAEFRGQTRAVGRPSLPVEN